MTPDTQSTHAADRLLAAIERKRAPVCVGLDPVLEKLPASMLPAESRPAVISTSLAMYCLHVMQAISPYIPCVKFQSACFERYRQDGVCALYVLLEEARKLGLEVILDAKRGDIGVSAEHYAAAALGEGTASRAACDWITINSYLGQDGITPFLQAGRGAFALVRTSNPGGDAIQNLELNDGRTVAQAVGELIASIGDSHIGKRGYSSLGAVVGATKKQDAAKLREIMPRQIFLVPGYGAQGGGLDDVLPCFNSDGAGAIVTASRSVIYAFERDDPNWSQSVGEAAASFAQEIAQAVGAR